MTRKSLAPYEASFNKVYARYKRNAKSRSIPFSLTPGFFKLIAEQNCTFCDASPTAAPYHGKYNGAWEFTGVDRIDNSVGYIAGNVQPCCHVCNRLKSDMSEDDFLEHITRIVINKG